MAFNNRSITAARARVPVHHARRASHVLNSHYRLALSFRRAITCRQRAPLSLSVIRIRGCKTFRIIDKKLPRRSPVQRDEHRTLRFATNVSAPASPSPSRTTVKVRIVFGLSGSERLRLRRPVPLGFFLFRDVARSGTRPIMQSADRLTSVTRSTPVNRRAEFPFAARARRDRRIPRQFISHPYRPMDFRANLFRAGARYVCPCSELLQRFFAFPIISRSDGNVYSDSGILVGRGKSFFLVVVVSWS